MRMMRDSINGQLTQKQVTLYEQAWKDQVFLYNSSNQYLDSEFTAIQSESL